MLPLFAILILVILGFTAMTVDLGTYAGDRRDAQNDADSIALAASQALPDEDAALAAADNWAGKNGIADDEYTIIVTPQDLPSVPNPKVTVSITRDHPFFFARVLGISEADVKSKAVAIKTSPGGAGGLTPWAVLESVQQAATPGSLVTLKYDATDVTTGNFGIIRLDGNGSSIYQETVEDGSESWICAQGVSGCADTSPVCASPICPSETGNKVGPTRTGTDYIITNTDPECDEFDEAFNDAGGGSYYLENVCNPWLDGGYESHRVIIIPIIASLCNGSCNLTVTSFALFWVEGYNPSACTGNKCEIQGRFVNAELTVNALTGVYDAESSLHFTRLSE